MQTLLTLLLLSTVMAIASFLAGILPLSVSLSRSQLRLISTIGMGVLVGTSLIVIIPEGVETLYKSNKISHAHGHTKRWLEQNSGEVQWKDYLSRGRSPGLQTRLDDFFSSDYGAIDVPDLALSKRLTGHVRASVKLDEVNASEDKDGIEIGQETEEEHEEEEAHHAWIGVALISGFVLMFLVDKLPQLVSSSQPHVKTHNIALNHIGQRFNLISSSDPDDDEHEESLDTTSSAETPKRGFAMTIGLVIHAAADGIALGASSSAAHTSLSLVIFFAIMIHKAPAAFGLTSILLRQGLSKRMVRTHLAVFSLAAPAGALLTWIVAHILSSGAERNASNTKWWTGVLLLFSAGTFLYVAMHSMQDVLDSHQNKHITPTHANGSLERRDSNAELQEEQKPTLMDIGAAVFGMILPLFLQVKHAH